MTDEQKRKYSEDFKQNHTIEELDADGDIDVVNDDGGAGAGAKRKPREGGKKRKLVAVPIHPPQHMTSMEVRRAAFFLLPSPPPHATIVHPYMPSAETSAAVCCTGKVSADRPHPSSWQHPCLLSCLCQALDRSCPRLMPDRSLMPLLVDTVTLRVASALRSSDSM